MSRNSLSKTDIINLALRNSGYSISTNIESDTSQPVKEALLHYKQLYADLISRFPWGFASCREKLQAELNEDEGKKFRYLYSLPPDLLFLWDIYFDESEAFTYGSQWDGRVYSYYELPIRDIPDRRSGWTAIEGNKIAADTSQLFCLYTTSKEINTADFSTLFTNTLINEIEVALSLNKIKDPELLRIRLKAQSEKKKEAQALTSRENRRGRRLPATDIEQHYRNYT